MALVCVSKPRCHVQYAVFAWGKRGEAALCTTEEEDMFSLVSTLISWWQKEVLSRGAELIPQREGNAPCCCYENESHLSSSLEEHCSSAIQTLWYAELSASLLLPTLKPSPVSSYYWNISMPLSFHIQILLTHLLGWVLSFPNPGMSSLYVLALLQHAILTEQAHIVIFTPLASHQLTCGHW